jgi:hypothetical protein
MVVVCILQFHTNGKSALLASQPSNHKQKNTINMQLVKLRVTETIRQAAASFNRVVSAAQ